MIDLHCHYLPGIDDGAQTLSDSLDLARAAVAAGIHTAVMTPHVHPGRYENSAPTIRKLCTAFQRVLEHQEVPLRVLAGGEVRISSDIISMVEQDQVPFIGELGGYRIMLLEFPHSHLLIGSDKLIKWLLARRIRPLIAHPERNKEVMRHVEKIEPYVQLGCLLQLTGASILGQFGKPAQQTALTIIERGWASVVATDAHNLRNRPPNLDQARAALVEIGGESLARQLTETTPGLVVSGTAGSAEPDGHAPAAAA